MEINRWLTSYNHNRGSIDRIEYIVIHYVGATGGAEANCQYYAEKNRGASAHYFVGHSGEIWQSVWDHDIAWHCGGKKYADTTGGTYHGICTNTNSIGIEMCVRKDAKGRWYFEPETISSAIELTKTLMDKYNVPVEKVIRHYDVTGKICPEPYVRDPEAWEAFKNALVRSGHWIHEDAGWLWMDPDGSLVRGEWRLINHHWYLFGQDGYILTGWQKKNDRWYYLEEAGDFQGACWHEVADHDGALERWYVE